MQETLKKSIDMLEFPKVKQELAAYTVSEAGKKIALAIEPKTSVEEVKAQLGETNDGLTLLKMKGGIPISPFENIRPYLKRLAIGSVLSGTEIASIYKIILNAKDLKAFFQDTKEEDIVLDQVYSLAESIHPLSELRRKVAGVIDEDGRVVDEASSKLKGIRTGIRQVEHRIRERLEKIVRGSQSRYLTDSIITIRNDRFVIPVKTDSKGVFGGVVHDQSSTGQTLFIEPQSVLEQNNKLREYKSQEKAEVARILAELSNEIAPYQSELEANLELLARFDFIAAKAKYSKELNATSPIISEENHIALYQARHPLIAEKDIVANDIVIGEKYKTIIVTGPNTGGKTVVLKTLGLLQIMGQSGLHIPADSESTIGVFHKWFADIGDEQSIEQSLSTFSSHMTNIVSILKYVDKDTLIVLDELGAGTDPQEGAALAIAMLDYIASQGSTVMITSHYPELKAYGYNRPQTLNASMEFNVDTLSPTYKLLLGIPGKSNAFEIARRLGLSEEVIESSKQLISGESQDVNQMIEDLDAKRQEYDELTKEAQANLDRASSLHADLKKFYKEYQDRSQELEEKAKDQANEIIEKAQTKAEKIIADLRQKQLESGGQSNVKEHEFIDAKSRLSNMKYEREHLKQNKVLQKQKQKKEFEIGDDVHVNTFDQRGTLVEESGNKEWVVQMGMLKMKVKEKDMTLVEKEKQEPQRSTSLRASVGSVRTEIDLRGERTEEAVNRLDRYIDQALLANYEMVTVIHGMGTGAVRKAVKEYLKNHSQVSSHKDAPANQGGNGATIVKFKS